ncbi:MAG TPA: flagellar biosynthetic protein FliR [Spirochaetota bacterium]|nr:flagellar biosynthetic protein FliR [Spirochaetota bacterium]
MAYFVYHFQVFLLILVRMSSMIFIAPFFSSALIPLRLKVLMSFLITLVIFPVVASTGYTLPGGMGEYALLVIQEITIGIFIGFLVAIIFAAYQLAGQFFAVQIGFGINEVIDPLAEVSIPLIGQLQNLVALLIFLAINGHHFMIKAVYRSYELAPVFSLAAKASQGYFNFLLHSFSGMFVVALKIALPVVATIFLVTVSLGVLAKAAPQMNIMMLGFPFKIAVAFGILVLTTPLIVRIMQVSLERTFGFVSKVILYWPQ